MWGRTEGGVETSGHMIYLVDTQKKMRGEDIGRLCSNSYKILPPQPNFAIVCLRKFLSASQTLLVLGKKHNLHPCARTNKVANSPNENCSSILGINRTPKNAAIYFSAYSYKQMKRQIRTCKYRNYGNLWSRTVRGALTGIQKRKTSGPTTPE